MDITISKAIAVLEIDLDDPGSVDILELEASERLAIEALKFRQRWEAQEGEAVFSRLPGELPVKV